MEIIKIFDTMDKDLKEFFIENNKLTVPGALYIICYFLELEHFVYNYLLEELKK